MRTALIAIWITTVMFITPLWATETEEEAELAKQIQNPVADLIGIPFQNNVNFGYGPDHDTRNILNIQPVIPLHMTSDWIVITRTIIPVISQHWLESQFGLGDIQLSLFLSPAQMSKMRESGKSTWGVGPIFQFPSATDNYLGKGKWCAGPTAVGVYMDGPWVVGLLANNIWSFAGQSGRPGVNQLLIQPFINCNLPHAWYFTFSPIITANWKASSGSVWTVPLGLGVGKVFKIGKLPLNGQVAGYYNAARPDNGPRMAAATPAGFTSTDIHLQI